MTKPTCQSICMELMALGDGRPPSLPPGVVRDHLDSCAECRKEAGELERLSGLLDSHRRQIPADDLWPLVERRLNAGKSGGESKALYTFFLLGAALGLYKLFELLPEHRIEAVFRLIPVIIAVSLFAYLKENPFKVNAQLGTDAE